MLRCDKSGCRPFADGLAFSVDRFCHHARAARLEFGLSHFFSEKEQFAHQFWKIGSPHLWAGAISDTGDRSSDHAVTNPDDGRMLLSAHAEH